MGNYFINGNGLLENVFGLILYKVIIYSVNLKGSR